MHQHQLRALHRNNLRSAIRFYREWLKNNHESYRDAFWRFIGHAEVYADLSFAADANKGRRLYDRISTVKNIVTAHDMKRSAA
tara:strand:+ start:279 stop:527 length:249 start_codon:yes stop_codon:yes gene_type:complete